MIRSLRWFLILALLVSVVSLGFYGGRRLRDAVPLRRDQLARVRSLLLSASNGRFAAPDNRLGQAADVPPAEIFETVLDYVQRDYVEEIGSPAKLSNGALARMFASLDDPKTYYLEPSLRRARQDELNGRFHGIGATLAVTKSKKGDVEYRYLTVVDTMPGSPAEKAGLKSGDRITNIGGHWIIAYSILVDIERLTKEPDDANRTEEAKQVSDKFKKGYSVTKAMTMLSTGEGTPLDLTVERAGQANPMKMTVTTATTEVDPVEFRVLDNNIGYLRIRQFNKKATDEFTSALGQVNGKMKGLIVDLRDNPGGVRATADTGANGYDSALKLIAHLTHGGAVATIEHHPNKREPLTVTAAEPVSVPMVALVDSGTANLSELVASALHNSARAKVIGTHTFGDSILESFTVLQDGSGVEIATAKLLSAGGEDLMKGIQPDIIVAQAPNANGGDAVLDRAVTALRTGA